MDIPWDSQGSLMRVIEFRHADSSEELVGRGTVRELVRSLLEMPTDAQTGLLLRVAGPDWTREFDTEQLRELAARPEYTGAAGDFDTSGLAEDPDVHEIAVDGPYIGGGIVGETRSTAEGRDGER